QRINQKKDPVILTPQAAKRIKELIDMNVQKTQQTNTNTNNNKNELPDGIRIGVKKGGCNGMEYEINYSKPSKNEIGDIQLNQHDVKIIVENRALLYMIGTTIDYKENDLQAGFVFNNPNVTAECG